VKRPTETSHGRWTRSLAWLALTMVLGAPAASAASAPTTPTTQGEDAHQVATAKGLRIELHLQSVEPAAEGDAAAAELIEGTFSDIRFRVSEAESGNPVSTLQPAVWISRDEGEEGLGCKDRIGRYLQGMLSFQADVDLNKYFILILNNDQTISVVDPLMGVSGVTQLYTMVVMEDRGTDWTRSADDTLLFVTMERAGKVAVVDLESFDVIESIEVGPSPTRIALQPDGRYLWVTHDGTGEGEGGVTVLDARDRSIAGRVATGPGRHDIAFSDDSLTAFVTNSAAGTVSIIDVQRLEEVVELPAGKAPIAVEHTALGGVAYVASEDGVLTVVDGASREVVARLETGAGLSDLQFDPSGRWGFAAVASENRVDVVDASKRAVVHRLETRKRPHQIVFTDSYAYIRHLGSAEVGLVPLAQLGIGNGPGVQGVVFGSRPPEEPTVPAAAPSIAPTGEYGTVVAANPSDRMVYYYMEGMIAPMGSYSTYGRVPRAVGVVDRSLRETEKGTYSARFRAPEDGDYTVALLLDSPWVEQCFTFTIKPDPTQPADEVGTVHLEYLTDQRSIAAGTPLRLELALSRGFRDRPETPLTDLEDVVVLATRLPGTWQRRQLAEPLEGGRYATTLVPDQPGAYYVSVSVPSLGLDFTELPYFTLRAVEREVPDDQRDGGR